MSDAGTGADATTALYRYFDSDGRLLYVGITGDPNVRDAAHVKKDGRWRDAAARVTVEEHRTRAAALAAEAKAIREEHPIYNVCEKGYPVGWGAGEVDRHADAKRRSELGWLTHYELAAVLCCRLESVPRRALDSMRPRGGARLKTFDWTLDSEPVKAFAERVAADTR